MSAYSTMTLTREEAEDLAVEILKKPLKLVAKGMTDAQLEELLDNDPPHCLTNYRIEFKWRDD